MNYKIPGIYIESEPRRIAPIKLMKDCIVGFVGVTERGPFNTAIRIKSFYEFRKIFGGFTEYAYLAYSVYGFFYSGGKECVVVRIAHFDEKNEKTSAAKAYSELVSVKGDSSFRLEALSEGIWGNFIKIKLWHINSISEQAIGFDHANKSWIELDNIDDFELDDTICIRSGQKLEYTKIKSIDCEKRRIYFTESLKEIREIKFEDTFCQDVRFNLTLINNDHIEEYYYLSSNAKDDKYIVKEINEKSKIVVASLVGENITPQEIFYSNLSNGRNGLLDLTPGDFIGHFNGLDDNRGMGVLESIPEISVIAAPDVLLFDEIINNNKKVAKKNILTVQRAMIDQCEKLGNRFTILDAPETENLMELINWKEQFDSMVAALYYPKIEIINPDDETGLTSIYIPPSGHIAGIYAETDYSEGVYRAPANKFIKGAVGLSKYINDDEYELLYPKGINCLKYTPGRGIKVWGARTLSSDIEWRYINVRRTFTLIKELIKNGTGWAVFEPNTRGLRKRIIRYVSAFLIDLWRKGYLTGNTPEEAFYVYCNDELNPPEEIDAGRINVMVGIAISKPAEFLVIRLKADSDNSVVFTDNL